MSWSYNDTLATARDKVRFNLGDTIEGRRLFENNEIDAILTEESDHVYRTCARLCDALAVRYTRDQEFRNSTISSSRGSISQKYLDMAKMFRRRAAMSGTNGGFVVPSISVDDKETNEDDDSIVQPFFKRGLHNYVGAKVDEFNLDEA